MFRSSVVFSWVARAVVLMVLGLFMGIGCAEPDEPDEELGTVEQAVIGAPAIVSTTIDNVTPVNGRYPLVVGQSYTVRVRVESGTISYLTRVEGHDLSPTMSLSPAYRDDSIAAGSSTRTYLFTLTPNATGIYQVAFHVRDRGTWNVYNIDGGVAVNVTATPPRIISTTINAPVTAGRYQLNAGVSYTVTLVVASGNVTYNTRIEGATYVPGLAFSPPTRDKVIGRYTGNHTFTFTATPSYLGDFQLGFLLRDLGTSNVFNVDGGVAITVRGSAPRIISTTIDGVTPVNGRYPLVTGQRYQVRVRVAPGYVANTFVVEKNEFIAAPGWANLHNNYSHLYRLDPGDSNYDFFFTLTPTEEGLGQVAFMLRDAPPWVVDGWLQAGTNNPYGHDGGVAFSAAAALAGIHGRVTNTAGVGIGDAEVRLGLTPGAPMVRTDADGYYQFPSAPYGTHALVVRKTGYSDTFAVNVPLHGVGIKVDMSMEQAFPLLTAAGGSYRRFFDYSKGRTLFHVGSVPPATMHTAIESSHDQPAPELELPMHIASRRSALLTINGGFFKYPTTTSVGYYYSAAEGGFQSSEPFATDHQARMPVFGIVGTGLDQAYRFVQKQVGFLDFWGISDWQYTTGIPLWDDNVDGVSDVSFALQTDTLLIEPDGSVIDWEPQGGDYPKYWARTGVGVDGSGKLLMVVADGERIFGAQGASLTQLGYFFRDTLGAVSAINFDGGGSSTMIVKMTSNTYREVSTPTAENPRWGGSPRRGVLNYLMAW